MNKGTVYRNLSLYVIALIFTLYSTAFADSTRYIYDDVNHVLRVESGGGSATITATTTGNGSISPSGTVGVAFNGSVSFSISPNNHNHIVDVKIDGVSNGPTPSYTFSNVTANHTIAVQFAVDTPQLNVTASDPAGGTVSSSPSGISCTSACSANFNFGTSVTLTATPNAGFNFTGWSGDCAGTGTCPLYMDSAKNVTAIFTRQIFVITATADISNTGGITPAGNIEVNYGGSQTFAISPNIGYAISNVLVDNASVGAVSSYTFNNVTANHTISPSFFCSNLPVQITAPHLQFFSTIQDAYNAAVDGDTIQAQALKFTGGLTVNKNINVSLQGGYTCDYSAYSGKPTTLKGSIQTLPGGGTLTVKNISLVADLADALTTATPPGGLYRTAQSVTLTCVSMTGTGCGNIYYTTDGSTPTTASAIYTGPILISSTTMLEFFAVDSAGNKESIKSPTYTIDTTLPLGSIAINGGAPFTNSNNVTINNTCYDNDGCSQMQFSNDNITWSTPETFAATKAWTMNTAGGDGAKTVYAKFMDTAGNWSIAENGYIVLDTIAPVTSVSMPGGQYNTALEIGLTCNDGNGSGCSQTYYTVNGTAPTMASPVYTGPLTVAATMTLQYASIDRAGNMESTKSQTYTIDPPPSGNIVINNGASATNSSTVTLTLTCTDDTGCSQMRFSNDGVTWSAPEPFTATKTWALAAGEGKRTVLVRFKDTAGNWSTALYSTILVDTTPPVTSASPIGGAIINPVVVALTCSDFGSGCDRIYYTTDGSTPTMSSSVYAGPLNITATTTVNFFAVDRAGNSESVKSQAYVMNAIRIVGNPQPFVTLQDAYNAAIDGDVIQVQVVTLTQDLLVNKNISVSLQGGFDSTFTTSSGTTVLKGYIQTMTGGGTLTIKNFIISQ